MSNLQKNPKISKFSNFQKFSEFFFSHFKTAITPLLLSISNISLWISFSISRRNPPAPLRPTTVPCCFAPLENRRNWLGASAGEVAVWGVSPVNPAVQTLPEKAQPAHIAAQRARRNKSRAPRAKSALPPYEARANRGWAQTATRAAAKTARRKEESEETRANRQETCLNRQETCFNRQETCLNRQETSLKNVFNYYLWLARKGQMGG